MTFWRSKYGKKYNDQYSIWNMTSDYAGSLHRLQSEWKKYDRDENEYGRLR